MAGWLKVGDGGQGDEWLVVWRAGDDGGGWHNSDELIETLRDTTTQTQTLTQTQPLPWKELTLESFVPSCLTCGSEPFLPFSI